MKMSRPCNRVVITTSAPGAQRIQVQLVYAPLLAFAIYPPRARGILPRQVATDGMETERDREFSPQGKTKFVKEPSGTRFNDVREGLRK
jgi:hypothetical protein